MVQSFNEGGGGGSMCSADGDDDCVALKFGRTA